MSTFRYEYTLVDYSKTADPTFVLHLFFIIGFLVVFCFIVIFDVTLFHCTVLIASSYLVIVTGFIWYVLVGVDNNLCFVKNQFLLLRLMVSQLATYKEQENSSIFNIIARRKVYILLKYRKMGLRKVYFSLNKTLNHLIYL